MSFRVHLREAPRDVVSHVGHKICEVHFTSVREVALEQSEQEPAALHAAAPRHVPRHSAVADEEVQFHWERGGLAGTGGREELANNLHQSYS